MSIENALPLILTRFRELLAGATTGDIHTVAAGYFRNPDPSTRLIDQPVGAFSVRPVEVEWLAEESADPEQPVTGNLIDRQADIAVRVGYVLGADIQSLQTQMYEDGRLIRRVLEHPQNYDSATTGLMTVTHVSMKTNFDSGDGDRRALLEMTFRVLYREDQPQVAA